MSLLKILENNKKAILLAELGALLHDLDKMSYDLFLNNINEHSLPEKRKDDSGKTIWDRSIKYDKKSVKKIKEERWREFFDGFDPEIKLGTIGESEPLKKIGITKITESNLSSSFVYHHHNDGGEYPLVGAVVQGGICGCDGIDSDLDKLQGNDGVIQQKPYRVDSPFGIILSYIPKNSEKVKGMQVALSELIKSVTPKEYFDEINKAFQFFLGETRFPCNDVTLWAHSYSVATLAKATLSKVLIEKSFCANNTILLPRRYDRRNAKIAKELIATPDTTDFTFLRVFLDRDFMLSRAQSTTDVLAVHYAIEKIQKILRQHVATELLIGNETYHDEEMQLFCIPKLGTWPEKTEIFNGLHKEFQDEVRSNIQETIENCLEERHLHEFPFEIAFAATDKDQSELNVSRRILKRSGQLLGEPQNCRQSIRLLSMPDLGADKKHGRCEVCGVRYAEVQGKQGGWVCDKCKENRDSAGRERNKRNNWVKEEIEKREESREDYSSESTDPEVKEKQKNPAKSSILLYTSDLSKCLDAGDNKLALISVNFDLETIRSGKIFDNVIVGKNKKYPSPGRLYRCWETLERFFTEFLENTKSVLQPGEFLKGGDVPLITIRSLNGWNPVFLITRSPKTLQFVASATNAATIISTLYDAYEANFGKFRASLPMSVGCVFFHDKFPLYVALDAAKLMREMLKLPLSNDNGKKIEEWTVIQSHHDNDKSQMTFLTIEPGGSKAFGGSAGPVVWRVPRLLSDGQRKDDFHPRFTLANGASPKHVDDLNDDHSLLVSDGRFDFIFLDSAVRRFDILPDGIQHHLYGKRKSYPLSAWKNFEKIWDYFGRLSDTQVKGIEGLLTEKMRAWRDEWNEEKKPWVEGSVIQRFCESVLFTSNALGKRVTDKKDRDFLTNAAVNGMLIDAIDLFVRLSAPPKERKKINSSDGQTTGKEPIPETIQEGTNL